MSWIQGPFLGFDTETTGVDVTSSRLVTAALVWRQDGTDTVSTWLADPQVDIPESATNVHGISTQFARENGQNVAEVLEDVLARLAAAVHQGVALVAFNGSFDLQLLHNEAKRHGVATLEDRLGGPLTAYLDPLVIDRAADRYRRGKRTLKDLIGVYQVTPRDNLHTAEVDVQGTLDVLEAQLQRFPALGQMSLPEMFQWQQSEHRKWARNFNEFLRSKGRIGDVAESWPMP